VLVIVDEAAGHDDEVPTTVSARSRHQSKQQSDSAGASLVIAVTLEQGLAISLVNAQLQELVYAQFRDVNARLVARDGVYNGRLSVMEMQADNQLLGAERWQFVYAPRMQHDDIVEYGEFDARNCQQPALSIEGSAQITTSYDAFEVSGVGCANAHTF
jgi:hypothetical protein